MIKQSDLNILEKLFSSNNKFQKHNNEIADYIELFSYYLYKVDPAYHYTPSFLVQKNQDFQDFYDKCMEKRELLIKFVTKFKKTLSQVSELIEKKNDITPPVIILNNFWEMNLTDKECHLSKDAKIKTDADKEANDIITLRYKEQEFNVCASISDKDLIAVIKQLITTKTEQVNKNE